MKITNEMLLRVMTGLMLVPLILGSIIFSKTMLQILLLAISVGMLLEWFDMAKDDRKILWMGIVIIAIPMSSLFALTMMLYYYVYTFLTYAAIICFTDMLAMFGGKYFGGPKLAQNISPNKTWSGLATGVLSATLATFMLSLLPGYDFEYTGFSLAIFTILMALTAQASDLLVSFFKRKFKLKDTGALLPGHGGILDRFDSLILTAPILLFVVS